MRGFPGSDVPKWPLLVLDPAACKIKPRKVTESMCRVSISRTSVVTGTIRRREALLLVSCEYYFKVLSVT